MFDLFAFFLKQLFWRMKYGLSSDKRRDFYRSNKWSSGAGLGLQRAWMGFFGHLCPEVTQACAVTPPCAGGAGVC